MLKQKKVCRTFFSFRKEKLKNNFKYAIFSEAQCGHLEPLLDQTIV